VSKVFVDPGIIQVFRYGMDVPFIVIPTKTIKMIEIKKFHPGMYHTIFKMHEIKDREKDKDKENETLVTWPYRNNSYTCSWEQEPVDLINKMIREWGDIQQSNIKSDTI
jgi:hypothetical protein